MKAGDVGPGGRAWTEAPSGLSWVQCGWELCSPLIGGASVMAQQVKNPPASAGGTGDVGSIPGSGRSPREGNGSPLQYSCLENSMGGEAWWAAVHGVAKSLTQLSACASTHTHIDWRRAQERPLADPLPSSREPIAPSRFFPPCPRSDLERPEFWL